MTSEHQLVLTIIAVSIAGLSLLISAFSLGWNVYRDVVLKARVKMRFSLSHIHHSTFPKPIDSLVLSTTNMGPGQISLSMIQLRAAPLWRRLLRKTKHAVMIHDYQNPLSGQLPAYLDVGERIDLLIRYERDCFLSEDFTHIGLSDSFGRIHWASAKDVKQARKAYQKKFKDNRGEQTYPNGEGMAHGA
jgi:hypothetical protein